MVANSPEKETQLARLAFLDGLNRLIAFADDYNNNKGVTFPFWAAMDVHNYLTRLTWYKGPSSAPFLSEIPKYLDKLYLIADTMRQFGTYRLNQEDILVWILERLRDLGHMTPSLRDLAIKLKLTTHPHLTF